MDPMCLNLRFARERLLFLWPRNRTNHGDDSFGAAFFNAAANCGKGRFVPDEEPAFYRLGEYGRAAWPTNFKRGAGNGVDRPLRCRAGLMQCEIDRQAAGGNIISSRV